MLTLGERRAVLEARWAGQEGGVGQVAGRGGEEASIEESAVILGPKAHLERAKLYQDQGEKAAAEGEAEEAIRCFALAIELNPEEQALAFQVAQAAKFKSNSLSLQRSKTRVGDEEAKLLARQITLKRGVESIELEQNDIGPEGAIPLFTALEASHSLTSLGLYKNKIGDSGAIALAKAVAQHPSLKRLDINENRIGVEGAEALADALLTNGTLTSFDVGYNPIGDAGVVALCDALKYNLNTQAGDRKAYSLACFFLITFFNFRANSYLPHFQH